MLSNELICNKTRMIKCSGPVRTREEAMAEVGGRGGCGCELGIGGGTHEWEVDTAEWFPK